MAVHLRLPVQLCNADQPFPELRPTPPSPRSLNCNRQRLSLPNEHDEAFAWRHAIRDFRLSGSREVRARRNRRGTAARLRKKWAEGGSISFLYSFTDLLINKGSNKTASEFVRRKIRATVKDPKTAELLCPNDHPIGTKRLILDTDYYETYNRDNVTLVDIRSKPIKEITPTKLRTTDADYALDAIVFATGFDAMTGAMKEIDIHTDAGMSVREKWEHGPRTYLGIMIAGFPNLFMITGPQSPGVKSQMILACEQHVDWIADCVQYLRDHAFSRIEAEEDAEDGWVQHNNAVADRTLYPLANSWYVGANIPGKPRVFMPYVGGVAAYKKKCDEIAARGYEGFRLGGRVEDARFGADGRTDGVRLAAV